MNGFHGLMRVFTFRLAAVLAAGVVAGACSSSSPGAASDAPPIDAGPPTVPTETCIARCSAKAQSCGAPAAQAGQFCAPLCGMAITEAQASCLESKKCVDLIAAGQGATFSTLCPGLDPAPVTVSGPFVVPAELTIATALPTGYPVVVHNDAGDLRSSLFNVAGPPLFVPTPAAGHFPSLAKGTDVTVVSPPRNGCESVFNVTITARQLAVSTSGVDTAPDTKCSDFIDAVAAQGLTLTLQNVPWEGSTETSTVTIVLRKLSSN